MKQKILISLTVILALAAAITFHFTKYIFDFSDTEEFFRENVSKVGYENTVETAIPQTGLYSVIKNHFSSEPAKGKSIKKAIVIGFDGCRADILAEMKNENSGISAMLKDGASITLNYCGGVNYPEKNTQFTSTAPGWCSILTGTWADVHGITENDITKSMDTKTLLTSLTEEKAINSAAFITKWAGHFTRENATYLEEKEYCEANKLSVEFKKCENDEKTIEYLLSDLKKEDCTDFLFAILEPTDSIGHKSGYSFKNPAYKEAFLTSDAYALEILEAIKTRENYETEDWLIIITSDHGGIRSNHGKESIQERMTFTVMNSQF